MKDKQHVSGVIVEYNPFHNGHRFHIEKTREITECDVLVAVMSPNFVQRGEPALIDKWRRTEIALQNGIDLVLELPTHLTLQSAETFARSAVKMLKMAGVETIVYGAESSIPATLTSLDKSVLASGNSYAKAKNTEGYQSNQILGAYYEDEAQALGIETKIIKRTNNYHSSDLSSPIASASAIRNGLRNQVEISHTVPYDINQETLHFIEDCYPFIRYEILQHGESIKNRFLVDEGIENLFIKLAQSEDTYEGFLSKATSRRYTASRIRRTLMHILLNTPRSMPTLTSIRVLGFNQIGQAYLASLKDQNVPLVTDFKTYPFKDYEERATQIYQLTTKKDVPLLKENTPPIII